MELKSLVGGMKPKETVVRSKATKAIEYLEKAKNVLNGYMPEAEELIDEAINHLFSVSDADADA
jgi:hypothetical protein